MYRRTPVAIHAPTKDDPLAMHLGPVDADKIKVPTFDPSKPLNPLSDGGFVCNNVEPGPALPTNCKFQSMNDADIDMDKRRGGYTLKPHEKPIRLGKFKDLIVDGTEWANKVNGYLDTVSDALPRLPMVMLILGGIGKGKTTTLCQLLSILGHPNAFEEIVVFSQSMGNDPVLLTAKDNRHPSVSFKTYPFVDASVITKIENKINQEYAVYQQQADIGKFKKGEDRKKGLITQAIINNFKPFDDPSHPYISSDGIHHGRDPHLPVLGKNHLAHLDPYTQYYLRSGGRLPSSSLSLEIPVALSTYEKQHIMAARSAKKHRAFDYRGREKYLDSLDDAAHVFNKHPYDLAQPGSRHIAGTMSLDERVQLETLANPDVRISQNQRVIFNKITSQPGARKDFEKKSGTLLVFEDCAYAFKGANGASIMRWITKIRHSHCAAIFLFQQVSTVPRIFRTVATHLIVFKINNANELKKIKDEFAASIPDFEGCYHAATQKVGDRDRDFLYVDIAKEKVCRSLEGELVPSADAQELWEDTDDVIETRPRKRKNKDEDHPKGSSKKFAKRLKT